jgi:hypothetical protein
MKKLLATLLAASMLSGCASIIKGKTQTVNIMTSDGSEAEATIFTGAGMQEAELPRIVSVNRNSQDITINIKENKCNNASVSVVNSHIEPWFWGNILSGGVFGSSTDAVTGSMWKYDSTAVVNVDKKSTCSK